MFPRSSTSGSGISDCRGELCRLRSAMSCPLFPSRGAVSAQRRTLQARCRGNQAESGGRALARPVESRGRIIVSNIRIPRAWEIPERLATPEPVFWNRRQVLAALGLGAATAALPFPLACAAKATDAQGRDVSGRMLEPATGARYAKLFPARQNRAFKAPGREVAPADRACAWNNFYEFSSA